MNESLNPSLVRSMAIQAVGRSVGPHSSVGQSEGGVRWRVLRGIR